MITRIRQLLDSKELSPTQFADLIGVGRPVVSHILSERNKPSLDVVQRIIGAFPEISLPWLLSGTGNMLDEAVVTPSIADAATAKSPVTAPAIEPIEAPSPSRAAPTPPLAQQPINSPISQVEVPPGGAARPIAPAKPAVALAPDAASVPSSAVAPVMKPFRAARFVPAAAAVPTLAVATAALPPAPLKNEPLPLEPFVKDVVATPDASPATEVSVASLPPVSGPAETTALPFLPEPGKAIRRIVIFYRDGSFADYQPEQ